MQDLFKRFIKMWICLVNPKVWLGLDWRPVFKIFDSWIQLGRKKLRKGLIRLNWLGFVYKSCILSLTTFFYRLTLSLSWLSYFATISILIEILVCLNPLFGWVSTKRENWVKSTKEIIERFAFIFIANNFNKQF